MITAESRDFRVATYSVVSLIGTACATWILTGIAGSPCACTPFVELPLQASPIAARDKATSSAVLEATHPNRTEPSGLGTFLIVSRTQLFKLSGGSGLPICQDQKSGRQIITIRLQKEGKVIASSRASS